MGNTPTTAISAAPPSTPDVLDSAIAESLAGRPASTNSKGSDVLDNAINDSLAGRPPMAQTAPVDTGETYGTALKKAGSDIYGVAASLAPATNTEAATTLPGKALGLAEDVAQGINNLQGITTVVDSVKNAAHILGAFHQARSNGASVTDALSAANERAKQLDTLTPAIIQRGKEWSNNKGPETLRALGDAVAAAAAVYGGAKVLPPTAAAVADSVDTYGSPSWLAKWNPYRKSITYESAAAPESAVAPAAATTSKIEPAVTAQTAKAELAPGDAGVTAEQAAQKTAQAAIDAKAATQANVDQTLQSIATRHAADNGIAAPTVGTASRDLITANGDALVDAGKANYKILDKFTDGKFTNAQNELKNAQLELRAKAGTTDADTSALEANVTRAQWNVVQLFDNAVKNGMPQETADAARAQFRTGQATLDAGNAVRMANKVRGSAGARTTDLNVLENRWTALSDSGRLQQAFGEQGAKDALTQVHAAREAGQVFESMPPTESAALRDLIAKNTTTGKFGTTTNWGKVQDAFSQMPERATRFSDIPKVEKFINDQKFYQRLRQGLVGTAVSAAGITGYEGIKRLIE